MKNETNTQQTPELSIAILWPYLFSGTKAKDVTLMVVDDAEAHAKEADEKTAGNAFFKYVPLSLALRSSELLKENKQLLLDIELQKFERERVSKENEQLKERIEALIDNHGLTKAKIEVIALQKSNAELLEAIKNVIGDISASYGFDATRIPNESVKNALLIVAKAEGKDEGK